VLVTGPTFAQEDHPLVPAFPGAKVLGHLLRDLDEFVLPLGPAVDRERFADSVRLEGRVTSIKYGLPPKTSTLAVIRHVEQALAPPGFKVLYRCAQANCGRFMVHHFGELYGFYGEEQRYLAAKLTQPQGDVFVAAYTNYVRGNRRAYAHVRVIELPPGSTATPAPPPRSPTAAARGVPEARGEFAPRVTYRVTGTATEAALTYRNANGGTEQKDVPLPWELTFDLRGTSPLYVSAQNRTSAGSVTCEILFDGVSRTNATSSGAYVLATCSEAMPKQ
jgi:hypothetical protein